MADQFGECSVPLENAFSLTVVKEEECQDEDFIDDKVEISETAIIAEMQDIVHDKIKQYGISTISDNIKTELEFPEVHSDMKRGNIKIEEGISADNIRIEFNNGLLYCEDCQVYREDYCVECEMLVHILNKIVPINADNRTPEQLPNGILEVQYYFGKYRVLALKVIPFGVRFGPFTGLTAAEHPWNVKGGKFVVDKDKSKYLNWMQYISPARNIYEQNLRVFQYDRNLYYESTRQIQVGDELLVYFGLEYEDSLNRNVEMDFIPTTKHMFKDAFACTFCCLGFSSKSYLAKHKKICPENAAGAFTIEDVMQCPSCKIHLDQKEYLIHHLAYCCERNDSSTALTQKPPLQPTVTMNNEDSDCSAQLLMVLNAMLSQNRRQDVAPIQPVGLTSAVPSTSAVRLSAAHPAEAAVRSAACRSRTSASAVRLVEGGSAKGTVALEVNPASQVTTASPLLPPPNLPPAESLHPVSPLLPPPYLPPSEYYQLSRAERQQLKARRRTYRKMMRLTRVTRTQRRTLPYAIPSTTRAQPFILAELLQKVVPPVSSKPVLPQATIPQITETVHDISEESPILVPEVSQALASVSRIAPSQSLTNVSTGSFTEILASPPSITTSTALPPVVTSTSISPPLEFTVSHTNASNIPIATSTNALPHTNSPNIFPPSSSLPPTPSISFNCPQVPRPVPHPVACAQVAPSSATTSAAANFEQFSDIFLSHVRGNSLADSVLQQAISMKQSVQGALSEVDAFLRFFDSVISMNIPGIPTDERIVAPVRGRKELLTRLENLIDEIIEREHRSR